MSRTTQWTGLDRRCLFRGGAALAVSLLWPAQAMAQAEPVQLPFRYEADIYDIISLCARYYGTTREAILSPLRDKREVSARQTGMYLVRLLTNRSLPEIGRQFGGRDHTTVLHAVRKIEALIDIDPFRRYDVKRLTDAALDVARLGIAMEQSRKALS
jgi:hypothetical protein